MEGRGSQVRWLWLLAGVGLAGLVGFIATSADRLENMRMTAQQTARTALDSQGMMAPLLEVRDGTMLVSGVAATQAEKQAICGTVSDSLKAAQMLGTPGVIARVACGVTAPDDNTSSAANAAAGGNANGAGGAGASGTGATSGTASGNASGLRTTESEAIRSSSEAAANACQDTLRRIGATERVTFALNGTEIIGGTAMLDQIAEAAGNCSQFVIEVGGHTDKRGGDALNVPLSQKRAEAVRDYLIGKGVAPAQLTARGYGSSRPVDPTATADDEPRNRRTEFTIIALD